MRILRSQDGFTYIAALVLVMIMGITASATSQMWSTIMKREMEEELIFRGQQYREAIEQWQKAKGQHAKLTDVKELLKDSSSAVRSGYIRRLYKDPVTGKDFQLKMDAQKGIIGVFSESNAEPLKKANFPPEFKDLEGKTKYSEWVFTFSPGQLQQGAPGTVSGVQGLSGSSNDPSPFGGSKAGAGGGATGRSSFGR